MGPCCPACKTRLPFHRTQIDLGKAFDCAGCGQSLVVPRGQNWIFLLGLLTLFWVAKDRFATNWIGTLALFALFCIIGMPALWLKTQVVSAETPDENLRSNKNPPKV